MKQILALFMLTLALSASAKKPTHSYVRIKTGKGECVVMLYNQTPKHRDNFLKLAKNHTYDGTLFHRVIQGFMIQGGDVDSKNAKPGQLLGNGDLGYKVDAEFRDSLFHKKGVLAAARDNNPEKASSSCQFYLAQGKTFTDEELDRLEVARLQGQKIPVWKREVYKTLGGIPHLDMGYTVYGEIVQGLEMVDAVAAVKTDPQNRPLEDVKMTVTILKKKEAKKLEKAMRNDPLKSKLVMSPAK
ncbi:peptidylprolyl isomerase [Hufsiella ginkgonis]|uniref:Peptidyl-prolyl cis-trans isomerase n=1 Tax=Hufsiella ginkgonis TaxID=2695274 RepID=A0A7K1XU05_9SPHI|nr:peptidylprolyl isomerase [Hufsiella ginkgonis]MXV14485.1 peptidylprolyl isomerase [Hufsiella ginkgonis]